MTETASCFLHGDFDAALRRCPECGAGRGSDTTGAAARNSRPTYRERDYLERTIATVRNHRDADNCWPQWANIFADEIERLWATIEAAGERLGELTRPPFIPGYTHLIAEVRDDLRAARPGAAPVRHGDTDA